jgi:hypothetical protein
MTHPRVLVYFTRRTRRRRSWLLPDGRFKDLVAVVDHYNTFFKLNLTGAEKRDLIQYLKSL